MFIIIFYQTVLVEVFLLYFFLLQSLKTLKKKILKRELQAIV